MSIKNRIESLLRFTEGRNLDKGRDLRIKLLRKRPEIIFDWLDRDPDQWMMDLLGELSRAELSDDRGNGRTIIAAARQCGKSEFLSIWLTWSITCLGHRIAISSPSFRQSIELASKVRLHMSRLNLVSQDSTSITDMKFRNGGRLITLPGDGSGRTARGFTLNQLAVDEAAFLPNGELLAALSPALSLASGSIILASSPGGTVGVFFDAWRAERWRKMKIRADECPRVPAEFLALQREMLTPAQYAREYEAEFTGDSGTWIQQAWIDQSRYDDSEDEAPGYYYDEEAD